VLLATVSHQHFYGLVIALLWPFCAGRCFEARSCEFPEDIILRGAAHKRFSLVSSPSHLARFSPAFDWQALGANCDCAISSAAPLKRADSMKASALLAAPVREIYGSSETGAIAWRCQQDSDVDASWDALPGVRLAATDAGTLEVRAPYLEVERLVLPDRVEFNAGGSFHLLGRIDRIVKVEGKRVSLSAIEALLRAHTWVTELRVLTLERARVETVVVLQLNAAGQAQLRKSGRKALIHEFKALLQGRIEVLAIPRRWRFVEQMPFNAQGKLPLQNLQALFATDDNRWPRILERRLVDGQLILRCRIHPGLDYFDGHMDGQPILPGIAQVHWAATFGRRWLPVAGAFERLEGVKFHQVILPHYEVRITLDFDAGSGRLNFCFDSERGVHSRGRICFSR
jgi:acyl-coenzyme A synthetase/AMP-(fatty) acid ligase